MKLYELRQIATSSTIRFALRCDKHDSNMRTITKLTDAIGRVGTVVVKAVHAVLACLAVFHLWRTQNIADLAVLPALRGDTSGRSTRLSKEEASLKVSEVERNRTTKERKTLITLCNNLITYLYMWRKTRNNTRLDKSHQPQIDNRHHPQARADRLM